MNLVISADVVDGKIRSVALPDKPLFESFRESGFQLGFRARVDPIFGKIEIALYCTSRRFEPVRKWTDSIDSFNTPLALCNSRARRRRVLFALPGRVQTELSLRRQRDLWGIRREGRSVGRTQSRSRLGSLVKSFHKDIIA
jgi:hypothetical protein